MRFIPLIDRGFRLALCGILFFVGSNCQSRKKFSFDSEEKGLPSELEEIAYRYYDLKEYRRAIRTYQKIIDQFSERPDRYEKVLAWSYYEIGFIHLVMRRYEEARPYFQTVMDQYSILAPRTLAEQRLDELDHIQDSTPNILERLLIRIDKRRAARRKKRENPEEL